MLKIALQRSGLPQYVFDGVADIGIVGENVVAGWSAVRAFIRESEFWEVIERLKEAGSQGVLVVPVEKMVL